MDDINFDENELLDEYDELTTEFNDIINLSKQTIVDCKKVVKPAEMLYILVNLINYNDKKQIFDEKLRTMNELNAYEVLWN